MNHSYPFCLFFFFCWATTAAQDTLVFENNWPYPAHVLFDQPSEIIFRKVGTFDTLIFTIEKRYVTEIRYNDPAKGRQPVKPAPVPLSKPLDIWISLTDSTGTFKGNLYSLDDTTLYLKKKHKLLEATKGLNVDVVYVLPCEKIQNIHVRRRNKVRQYATIGAVGGFVLGTLTGLVVFESDPPCIPLGPDGPTCDNSLSSPRSKTEKSLLLGLGTGGVGFLAGGITGSIRINIPIGGKRDAFKMAVPRLRR